MTIDYDGDEIMLEEMPQGCVITKKNTESSTVPTILVSSPEDALALLLSLKKMLKIQHIDFYNAHKSDIIFYL